MTCACSVLTSVALFTTFSARTYAEDSVNSLENKTSDLQNELSELNSELEKLSAELDATMKKIETTTKELTQTKQELANAKAEADSQYQSMKRRIKYIYENGNTSTLEILFQSGSMAEFLNKVEFVSSVSKFDQIRLEQLSDIQRTVAEKEEQLQSKQKTLTSLQKELHDKEEKLKAKVSTTSGELQKYTIQLAEAKKRAKEAEEALKRQIEAERAAAEKAASQAAQSGAKPPTTTHPPVSASATELELFAALIECEAGSTNYDGMLAVASVVINRVNHRYYPDTITGVIYQSGQFSPIRQGKVDKVLKRGVKSVCVNVAKEAIAGKNNVGSCLNFRAASTGHYGINIGGNVFF